LEDENGSLVNYICMRAVEPTRVGCLIIRGLAKMPEWWMTPTLEWAWCNGSTTMCTHMAMANPSSWPAVFVQVEVLCLAFCIVAVISKFTKCTQEGLCRTYMWFLGCILRSPSEFNANQSAKYCDIQSHSVPHGQKLCSLLDRRQSSYVRCAMQPATVCLLQQYVCLVMSHHPTGCSRTKVQA
jgi:hypothetical protein